MKDRISIEPSIHHGEPVIRGTRVPVATIEGALAGGMSVQDVARDYDVTVVDIEAALEYSATTNASAATFSQLDAEEGDGDQLPEPK